MSLTIILSFVVTMIISACLIPIVIKAGNSLGIVAHKNERTIHKKEIARIGGYAIYISSLIGSVLFLKTDPQINAILIGGFIVFIVGLYDDVHNLSPKIKLFFEVIATLIVIIWGNIYIKGFHFVPSPYDEYVSGIVTLFWIIGITNAINLIDGLDGLSAGISIIVLFTISMTSLMSGRTDIASLSLLLAGSIMGFLFFNFHPAKIFMGDCGALYIGFMIAVISLLGFGYSASAFFTLGAPIVVLMVPIMDTLIAIIRRKLHHKKFSDADRSHLHHNLMFKLNLGQTKSVLVLYAVTFMFSLTSYMYYYDATLGIIMFLTLMFGFEIFVEMTDMIGRKYKPVLTVFNLFLHSDQLPKIRFLEDYRMRRTPRKRQRDHLIIALVLLTFFTGVTFYFACQKPVLPQQSQKAETPYIHSNHTSLSDELYERLDSAYQTKDEEEGQLVAAYFVSDYYSFAGKDDETIGGLDYIYPDQQSNFYDYAKKSFYLNKKDYPDLKVTDYNIISYSPSKLRIEGLEDQEYYNALVAMTFNEEVDNFEATTTITLVKVDDRFYVCGVDNA